jgi:hypothetical protein
MTVVACAQQRDILRNSSLDIVLRLVARVLPNHREVDLP